MLAALAQGGSREVRTPDVLSVAIHPKVRAYSSAFVGVGHRSESGRLKALDDQRMIEFFDEFGGGPPTGGGQRAPAIWSCVRLGNRLSDVIAANYAYAIGAGLNIIAETDKVECGN